MFKDPILFNRNELERINEDFSDKFLPLRNRSEFSRTHEFLIAKLREGEEVVEEAIKKLGKN